MEPFQRQKVNPKKLPAPVQAKWPTELLEEGFVPFPKTLLRTLTRLFGASPEVRQLALLLAVVDYRRPNLSRQPSLGYLAFLAGLNPTQAAETLDDLQRRGWVTVHPAEDTDGVEVKLAGFYRDVARSSEE